MKHEGLFGLPSLLRSSKDVLWIGAESEVPDPSLSRLLPAIKFLSYVDFNKSSNRSRYPVLVVSWHNTGAVLATDILSKINCEPAEERLLVLRIAEDEKLSEQMMALINCGNFTRVLFLPEQSEDLCSVIDDAIYEASRFKKILSPTKKSTEKKISQTKGLVKFVKELSVVSNVESLMGLLKNEVRTFQKVKEPILAFARGENEFILLFFQGTQVTEKVVTGVWPQQIRLRLNDVNDSQYLANIFGRPFGKLLSIPLKLKRKSNHDQLQVSAVLFLEHALSTDGVKDFFEFIEERLQTMSIALDRLLLEQDMNEASMLWEQTFDGLQDPVAIFDSEMQILRANKSFVENLGDLNPIQLFGDTLVSKNKFYEIHSYPISLGEAGLSTNIINHYMDVTHAHTLKNQMIQSEKMAAIGHMAGHIAHELNNPLTGVRSLAQILIEQAEADSTIKKDLIEVESAAERCQIIIKNLIEFSSGDVENQQVAISINEIISRTLPLIKTLISRFELNMNLTKAVAEVFVQPNLMQQVVFNIIKNAAQAMGEKGTLTIETQVENGRVVLRVRDTGGGIDPKIEGQIFDSFFTTKSHGQGTGLGLSMSKNIVDRFSGQISVANNPGQGSEFIISLPLAKSSAK